MGIFSGIGDTELYESGVYLSPGASYELKFVDALVKKTKRSGLAFIVEFEVEESTHDDHPVGSKATWFQKMSDEEIAFRAIKEFLANLLKINMKDPIEKEEFNSTVEELLDQVTEERLDDEGKPRRDLDEDGNETDELEKNVLYGFHIHCDTRMTKTKEKNLDFTAHNWRHSEQENPDL
jgi:hypothetical protein